MMYPLVRELAGDGIPVTVTCRVLKIARQPYYRWLASPVTAADVTAAYRANALFDAHRDDPEFGYRFLLDEARDAGDPDPRLRHEGERAQRVHAADHLRDRLQPLGQRTHVPARVVGRAALPLGAGRGRGPRAQVAVQVDRDEARVVVDDHLRRGAHRRTHRSEPAIASNSPSSAGASSGDGVENANTR